MALMLNKDQRIADVTSVIPEMEEKVIILNKAKE